MVKKIIMILGVIAMLSTSSFANDEATNNGATNNDATKEIEVVARLVEIPGTMPPNDLYNYVYIFKYKVVKVIKGELKEKEILVGQYNPLMARSSISDKMKDSVSGNLKKFVAGDKHILTLVQPLESKWQEAVEDEYFDDESLRWFCIKADKTN